MAGQYVGIDLHKHRSVIVRADEEGNHIETLRIDNDPVAVREGIAQAGPEPEVVIEATAGWYWAVDVLLEAGAKVHLAHPLGLNWGQRRVKNDERDAADLIDMLRLGRLPESWIAPPKVRELREIVRYRAKLVAERAAFKAQVKGVLGKEGIVATGARLWSGVGATRLDEMNLAPGYRLRVDSLRSLIAAQGAKIKALDVEIATWLTGDSVGK